MLRHSSKLAQITSSKASFPNLPHRNTEADAARRGLRRNASLKAHSLSSALREKVKQKLHWHCLLNSMQMDSDTLGSAFIALSGAEREELSARIKMSKLDHCPLPKLRFPDAQWVKPQLMARVRHLSGASYLRHAVRSFS